MKLKPSSTTHTEDKPKRSRSTEDLASKSYSTEGPFDVSSKESGRSGAAKVTASAADKSGNQGAQKARDFWKEEESTGKVAKPVESRKEAKKKVSKKKEESTPLSSSKPPLPTGAKEKKKLGECVCVCVCVCTSCSGLPVFNINFAR